MSIPPGLIATEVGGLAAGLVLQADLPTEVPLWFRLLAVGAFLAAGAGIYFGGIFVRNKATRVAVADLKEQMGELQKAHHEEISSLRTHLDERLDDIRRDHEQTRSVATALHQEMLGLAGRGGLLGEITYNKRWRHWANNVLLSLAGKMDLDVQAPIDE